MRDRPKRCLVKAGRIVYEYIQSTKVDNYRTNNAGRHVRTLQVGLQGQRTFFPDLVEFRCERASFIVG